MIIEKEGKERKNTIIEKLLIHTIFSLIFTTIILFTSCDMIEYHPYDCDVSGETNLTVKNIEKIESLQQSDTLRFALISDTQRWYDDTYDAVKALKRRNDISFVVHCGDISDFGATKEFMWQRDILQKLRYPYICVIGNHDFLGTGEYVYKRIFGALNFAFTISGTRFICLNTNALEAEEMDNTPDLEFLDKELSNIGEDISQTIIVIHAQPFSEQFNNAVADKFNDKIKEFPNLLCVLSGHGHSYSDRELFGDGTHYIMCPCIHERTYLVFTVTKGNYSYEIHKY